MKIQYKGKEKTFDKGTLALDILKEFDEKAVETTIAVKINDKVVELSRPIEEDGTIQNFTFDDDVGKDIFRHSSAHLMAEAIMKLNPDAKLTIGPTVDEGFYYDVEVEKPFTNKDLKRIEHEMHQIAKKNEEITREEITKEKAKELFKGNVYKEEMIEDLDDISIYKQGDFFDLCRGPHLPRTGMIRAFKLTKTAGAYWRGDQKNTQLQRVYGISFPNKEQLQEHLKLLEEIEKRDHRKLGKQLDIFSIHDEAPGMPFFHNKGTFIFNKLGEFMMDEMKKLGYEINKTPMILNKQLWLQSGHWNHYKENMYFTKIDDQDFAVKPMNCPGNILVYKTKVHSYRELPIKAGEFGLVHRHELSGVLSGLFRVRAFTQDDAHVFCTEEQIEEQIIELIDLVHTIYSPFGFEYNVELSTKPEKAMGDPKLWQRAEKALEDALKTKKIEYKINQGDGAFYGPKIDFHVKDALGRSWQCGTIQLDFSMPEKFDLTFEGQDGQKHRPVMLHRAIYGSFERFIGILIEHFAGKFPLWLSPEQIVIITVADRFVKYAEDIKKQLQDNKLRVKIDARSESIPKKVRTAQLEKIPIMLTVGEKEEQNKTLAVRTLDGKVKFDVKVDDLIKTLKTAVDEKKLEFEI